MRNEVETGRTKATEKRRIRDPGEIWIISLAMTVDKRFIVMVTMTAQFKPGSKRMQRRSGILIRRKIPTSPLVEDTRNHW